MGNRLSQDVLFSDTLWKGAQVDHFFKKVYLFHPMYSMKECITYQEESYEAKLREFPIKNKKESVNLFPQATNF